MQSTHEQVRVSIIVVIAYRYRHVVTGARQPGFLRNIGEHAFAVVAKQVIGVFRIILLKCLDVRAIREKNVRPSVFVVIKDSNPARHRRRGVRSLECLVSFNTEWQALQNEFDSRRSSRSSGRCLGNR